MPGTRSHARRGRVPIRAATVPDNRATSINVAVTAGAYWIFAAMATQVYLIMYVPALQS